MLNKKQVTISALAGLGMMAVTPPIYDAFANTNVPVKNDMDACNTVQLRSIDVGQGAFGPVVSATYFGIACPKDEFGRMSIKTDTFVVDPKNIREPHIIANLGAAETSRISNILNDLIDHADKFPTESTVVAEGVTCEPFIEVVDVEIMGPNSSMVTIEQREPFSTMMRFGPNCKIETSHEFSFMADPLQLEKKYGAEAGGIIHAMLEATSKPLGQMPQPQPPQAF